MILFFYNLALLAALVAGAPWWLWRIASTEKYREGLLERLGRVRIPADRGGRPLIWIHAVSVGEVLAVSRLVKMLDAALPDYLVAVSTTTRTGQELARERFGAGRVFYCPLDLPWAVRACLNALRPSLLVLAETEFWPNLLSGCFRRSIPVAVINARVSDRSWPRYRRLRWLWRPFLSRLSLVLAQSEADAERLKTIGCLPERVSTAGNLKFDVQATHEADATRVLKALKFGNRLVVAGSTLEGEEAALLAVWPLLLAADPRLVLVLAPRHPERFAAVAGILEASGLPWKKRTNWREQPAGSIKLLQPGQVVLLDTIGELASVYSIASAAFVGGSLIPAGGHNPLEPAQFGVPILMGPHYANFRAITDDLLGNGAIRITEPDDLAGALIELLQHRLPAAEMGARAKQVFLQQSGATARCVQALQHLLPPLPIQPRVPQPKPIEPAVSTRAIAPHPPCPPENPPFSPRKLLLPLVPAYTLALRARERRLGSKAAPFQHLRFPVVSIGNLSTGGAGKTPLTIALADALARCGLQVDVLSRGYGRKSTVTLRVDPAGTAEEFGDEPILIARRAAIPVYVSPRRFDAGLLAETDAAALASLEEEPKPVIHLLDDGFQHRQLYRNADILLLGREDWTDTLLPAGNLREPLTALRRAGAIAIPASDSQLEADLRAWGWQGPVWRLRRKMEPPSVAGPVFAFCGIARPRQFFAGLQASGLQLAGQLAFPDHYTYTARDLERLLAKASAAGAAALVTTEKDSIRLGKLATAIPASLPLKTVGLHIEIEREDEAVEWLLDRLPLCPSTAPL